MTCRDPSARVLQSLTSTNKVPVTTHQFVSSGSTRTRPPEWGSIIKPEPPTVALQCCVTAVSLHTIFFLDTHSLSSYPRREKRRIENTRHLLWAYIPEYEPSFTGVSQIHNTSVLNTFHARGSVTSAELIWLVSQ